MRCPSCGTENAPDSRFCGGCGAWIATAGQRVAPTQRIPDDASFPQRSPTPAGAEAQVTPPAAAHPAVPTQYPQAPEQSQPIYAVPAAYPTPSPAGSPRAPGLGDPTLSMPIVARRPWGLIVVVLLIDLGLAASGTWMLSAGLDAPSATPRSDAAPTAPRPTTSGAIEVTPIEPAHAPRPAPHPAGSK